MVANRTSHRLSPPGPKATPTRPNHAQNRRLLKRMRALRAGVRFLELLVGDGALCADGRAVHDEVVVGVVVERAAAALRDAELRLTGVGEPGIFVGEDGAGVAVAGVVDDAAEVAVFVVAGVACGQRVGGVGVGFARHAVGEHFQCAREGDARAVEGGGAWGRAFVHLDVAV